LPRFSAVSTPPGGKSLRRRHWKPSTIRQCRSGDSIMVVTCMCVLRRGWPRLRPAGGRVRVRPGRGAWLPPDPLKISFSWTAVRDREECAVRSPESSSNHERTTDITDFRGRVSVPGKVCPRKPRLTLPRAESLPDHETRTTGQRGAKAASPAPGSAIPPRSGSPPPAPPAPAPSRPEPATRRKLALFWNDYRNR